MADQQRDKFEQAAAEKCYSTQRNQSRPNEYLYEEVQAAWEIWQAGRASKVEPAGVVNIDDDGVEFEQLKDLKHRDYLFLHPPASQVPDGWRIKGEPLGRISIEAEGIGFYVARMDADRISEIMLYALAQDLLSAQPQTPEAAVPDGYVCHSCGNKVAPPKPFSMSVYCRCGHSTAATIAANLAKQNREPQTPGDGWVRCSERLPKHGQLVRSRGMDGREFDTKYFCDDRRVPQFKLVGKVWDHFPVIEWKPADLRKPQPPQEG